LSVTPHPALSAILSKVAPSLAKERTTKDRCICGVDRK
jgi:hypothetical protein